mgnify:CR=1 FL=1
MNYDKLNEKKRKEKTNLNDGHKHTHTHTQLFHNKQNAWIHRFFLLNFDCCCLFFSVVGRILSWMALPFFQKRYQNKWVLCECMGISIVHIT